MRNLNHPPVSIKSCQNITFIIICRNLRVMAVPQQPGIWPDQQQCVSPTREWSQLGSEGLDLPTFRVWSRLLLGRRQNNLPHGGSRQYVWLPGNTELLLVYISHVTWILISYWLREVTEYCTLIGWEGSCNLNTDLLLVERSHVTWILNSDWSRVVTWPEYWPVIGWDKSRDLNTDLLLVETNHVTWILTCDWLREVTWPEYWLVIGWE